MWKSMSVTPGEDTWLIDSGASKHMTGKKKTLSRLEEKNSPQKVSLGDDYQYPIKHISESSYKLDSRTFMNMKEVLYVPGLKKNYFPSKLQNSHKDLKSKTE